MIRAALAAALLVAAGLSVHTLLAHHDALDRDRALLAAQTERFGPGTRGRIAAWAAAERPGAALDWRAGDPGLFDDRVPVALTIGDDGPYRFTVRLGDRAVEPADGPTRALVERVAAWAGDDGGRDPGE